ncbi:MAG TPA: GNAT family N-acetyltransferase [Candidatus Acidoferrum sp.]|nr:GNAT family N-acetyltransferase [Candidatus Acidoferrum sp.]
MEIDPATEGDLPALLPLLRGYCDFYEVSPPDDGLTTMARALVAAPDTEGILLVARDGDRVPVGFAIVCWKWSSLRASQVAVMEDLFVAAESRGRGIADALIEACAQRARELGAPALTWLTAVDNQRAQAVYNRTGANSEPLLEYDLELG